MKKQNEEPEVYMPHLYYAWDIGSFTEMESQMLKKLVKMGYDLKVGMTALMSYQIDRGSVGKLAMDRCAQEGGRSIADVKFYDIHDQVVGAIKGLIQAGASGGITVRVPKDAELSTLRAIAEIRDRTHREVGGRDKNEKKSSEPEKPAPKLERPILFGFSKLSSLNKPPKEIEEALLRTAEYSRKANLGGIVVPGRFLEKIQSEYPDLEKLVVGIRPEGMGGKWTDDQRHSITHLEAVAVGGFLLHLVIGRPIRLAENPLQAAGMIINDLRTRTVRAA